jgi:hypothetical protein
MIAGQLYTDGEGKALTGQRAAMDAMAPESNAVLVNVGRLREAFDRAVGGAREGQPEDMAVQDAPLPEDLFHDVFPSDEQVAQIAAGKIPPGAKPDDYVLMSRAGADAWRSASRAQGANNSVMRMLDKATTAWKAGLLASRPAWYIHVALGHLMQYTLLSNGDFRSIIQASRPEVREGIPARIETALRGMGDVKSRRVSRALNAGFKFNDSVQMAIRRGGYLSAAKRIAKEQGISGSPEAIIDEVARHPELARAVLTRFHRFLGDYRSFNSFEQNVMRRIFPFYSWLRVITRLAFSLPARSPLKALALTLGSRAAYPVENPLDYMLPSYDQGNIAIGNHLIGVRGFNPLSQIEDLIQGYGQGAAGSGGLTGGIKGVLGALGGSAINPLIQAAIGELTGVNPFTQRPYSAPPGIGGSTSSYGQAPQAIDPITGQPVDVHPTPGILQDLLDQAPILPQLRSLLAGGRPTYDTTTDPELLRDFLSRITGGAIPGPNPVDLYRPAPKTPSGVAPSGIASTLEGLLGAPVHGVDWNQVFNAYYLDQARQAAAAGSTERQRAKDAALIP